MLTDVHPPFLGNERNLPRSQSPHKDDYTHIIAAFSFSNKLSNNIYVPL